LTIHKSAKDGDCAGVLQAITDGIPVDQLDEKGFTALAYAASSRNAGSNLVALLIEKGADVNFAIAEDSKFLIGLAAASGSIPKVQMLMDAGANIQYESKEG